MKKKNDCHRDQRPGKLSLRKRLTLMMGGVVLVSLLCAFGIAALLGKLFPALEAVPMLLQLNILCLGVAMAATSFLSKIFFDPIKILREGMQKVAEGDFSVHLETKSSSAEMQEVFAGFNMMTRELRSTEILQTDFVSNVSHEFKTPINAIEGYATLLQSTDNIDEIENQYIEKILFNTKRLSSLVSNVLLLSKLENQSLQLQPKRFRLDEQVREVIVDLEPAWAAKELDFDVELQDISYFGSEKLLYHVWSNLLSNAIKFSPQGGVVTIHLYRDVEQITFRIEDCGPGISEGAQKHIFDKFYQEDTSHKSEGNGLGLALVKRILAITGGNIKAENISEGCRFTVTLFKEK